MIRVVCSVAALLLLGTLAACAPPKPFVEPLKPASAEYSGTNRYVVTYERGDRSMRLQVVLQVSPSQLLLVGLSPLGQRLFTLTSTGNRISLESSARALTRLDPARIVSDIQLAYWPLPKLENALPDAYRIEEVVQTRLVWHGDRLLWLAIRADSNRWQAPVTIYNLRAGYRLRVVPADTGVDSTTTE